MLLFITLAISIMALTVAFFLYLHISSLLNKFNELIKVTLNVCDNTNEVITQNLKLQEIVDRQIEVINDLV